MNNTTETIEQAAERIYDDNLFNYEKYREKYRDGFIRGANWQKEQDEAQYKALLDSHNELLQTLEIIENSKDNSEDYYIGSLLSMRIKETINKAKNI